MICRQGPARCVLHESGCLSCRAYLYIKLVNVNNYLCNLSSCVPPKFVIPMIRNITWYPCSFSQSMSLHSAEASIKTSNTYWSTRCCLDRLPDGMTIHIASQWLGIITGYPVCLALWGYLVKSSLDKICRVHLNVWLMIDATCPPASYSNDW